MILSEYSHVAIPSITLMEAKMNASTPRVCHSNEGLLLESDNWRRSLDGNVTVIWSAGFMKAERLAVKRLLLPFRITAASFIIKLIIKCSAPRGRLQEDPPSKHGISCQKIGE